MRRVAAIALAIAAMLVLARPADANPHRARALLSEARLLLEQGKPGEALATFEEAIDHDVDLLAAYTAAVPLWIQAGELSQMRRRLERATARHPRFATGWYALGYAYRHMGRPDLAAMAYQSYIALRPGEAAPYFGLAMAHKLTGDPAAAERAFRRYLQSERDPLRADFVAQAQRELLLLVLERYLARLPDVTSSQSGS